MANVLKLKRSTTASASPASLVEGEVAVNEADGKLFFRKSGVVTGFSLLSAAYAAATHVHDAVTTTVAGFMSAADKVKLNSIATSATANDSDANLKNRANHTGSQAISTVTDLQTSLDAKVTGTGVTAERALTQAEYDAIGTKSTTTLYFIKAS